MARTATKTLAAVLLTTAIGTAAGQAGATPAGITLQPADTATTAGTSPTGSAALGSSTSPTGSTALGSTIGNGSSVSPTWAMGPYGPVTTAFGQLLVQLFPTQLSDCYSDTGGCTNGPLALLDLALISPSAALGL